MLHLAANADFLKGSPVGEELSHLKQTWKNGMCTSVCICVGEGDPRAGGTAKSHTLQQL